MAWFDVLGGAAFRQWILAVGGQAQISQGQRLDPFATSMRVFKNATEWLEAIEQSGTPGGTDPIQKITDLAGAGLVERVGATANITSFGKAVLEEWRRLDVANAVDGDELPRCLVVVQEAHNFSIQAYEGIRNFWGELRQFYSADDLVASPESLYAVSYFNQEVGGYNPWRAVRSNHLNGGIVHEDPDWGRIETQTPNADAPVHRAIEDLSRRIDDAATRASGRINFCRAMELATLEPDEARTELASWRATEHANEACLKLLPTSVQSMAVDAAMISSIADLIRERSNVILYGPPGTGKTVTALAIAAEWQRQCGREAVFQATFHPSYSYEDFVQGFRPKHDQPDQFELRPGVLLEACDQAMKFQQAAEPGTAPASVLLVLDEINRGDVSRIFGELISYIEGDKRGLLFRLSQEPNREFAIPSNLHFLGTMNTADKSISLLDVALRRRFAFWSFDPDASIFARIPSWENNIGGIELGQLLQAINVRLLAQDIEPDRAVGQAVLKIKRGSPNPLTELRKRVRFDLWPLISEYCYIDRSRIRSVLGDLVDESGKLLDLPDEGFKGALANLINASAPAAPDEEPDGPASVSGDEAEDEPDPEAT